MICSYGWDNEKGREKNHRNRIDFEDVTFFGVLVMLLTVGEKFCGANSKGLFHHSDFKYPTKPFLILPPSKPHTI